MRRIGDPLPERQAERLSAFLNAQGIEATVRSDDGGTGTIWVLDEDRLTAAETHFAAFRLAPDAASFNAPARPKPDTPARPSSRARHIDVRSQIFQRSRARSIPVTLASGAVSVFLTLIGSLPGAGRIMRSLYFSEYMGREFPEIAAGQVWRLFTPIFMHGGFLHLFFNMLWLYQLGGMVESTEGSAYTMALILITGAACNTAQYLVLGSPLFMGMSGVVYALFGYIWMMSRFQAGTRYAMPRETVLIMLFWLGIGFLGLIQGVANTEHLVGLVLGVAWGYLRSGYFKTVLRRRRYRG
jgi:GlpG protein